MAPSCRITPFSVVLGLIFTSSLILAGFYFDVEYSDFIQLSASTTNQSAAVISIEPSIPNPSIPLENITRNASTLRDLWQCLFYDHILRPKYLNKFDDTPLNQQCSDHQYYGANRDIYHYLHWTNLSLSTLSPSNDYRSLLSIRRYLLIITMHSDLKNTLSSDTTSTLQFLMNSIISRLITMHQETLQFLMNSIRNRKKKYFNIHVVKSAGSTVCRTFNGLGFKTSSPNSLNCNVRSTNSAWKLPDFGEVPCSKYFQNSGKYDMIAFERPMHGQGEVRVPILCDQFVYILPFRHPIRRIYSLIDQINTKDLRQPTDFIVKREVLEPNASSEEVRERMLFWIKTINQKHEIQPVCSMKVFEVIHPETKEHLIYSPLYLASDFEGFFEDLYLNEAGDDIVTEINMTSKYSEHSLCWRNEGVYRLYWFGESEYSQFAFKVANNWTSNSKQQIDKVNIDFVRGWLTNLFVRTMGYEHKKGVSYDALYAKNYEITRDHFVNAVQFMMAVDYILPFERETNHSMWHYVFDQLKDQHNHTEHVPFWLHANSGSHLKRSEEWLNSEHIEGAMTEEDRQIAKELNALDLWLYDIANMIADADDLFLHQEI